MKTPAFTLNEARVLLALVVNAKSLGAAEPTRRTAYALGGTGAAEAHGIALSGAETKLGRIVAAGEAAKQRRAARG